MPTKVVCLMELTSIPKRQPAKMGVSPQAVVAATQAVSRISEQLAMGSRLQSENEWSMVRANFPVKWNSSAACWARRHCVQHGSPRGGVRLDRGRSGSEPSVSLAGGRSAIAGPSYYLGLQPCAPSPGPVPDTQYPAGNHTPAHKTNRASGVLRRLALSQEYVLFSVEFVEDPASLCSFPLNSARSSPDDNSSSSKSD